MMSYLLFLLMYYTVKFVLIKICFDNSLRVEVVVSIHFVGFDGFDTTFQVYSTRRLNPNLTTESSVRDRRYPIRIYQEFGYNQS